MYSRLKIVIVMCMEIPGYTLFESIGHSTNGPVWRATTSAGDERVVQILAVNPKAGWDERAQMLLRLSHPGLANLKDLIPLADGRWAVVTELAEGVRLDVLASSRRLNLGQIVYLGIQLGEALSALHEKGLAHGDVSPANVIISERGKVRLIDVLGHPRDLGTPDFAAPERPHGCSIPGDVYSLAKVLEYVHCPRECLEGALSEDPNKRSGIKDLLESLRRVSEPEALEMPSPTSLIIGELRSSGQNLRTERMGEAKRRRHRQESREWLVPPMLRKAGFAAALLAATVAGAYLPEIWKADDSVASVSRVEVPVKTSNILSSDTEANQVLYNWLRQRDRAIREGNKNSFYALSVPGSPLRESEQDLFAVLPTGPLEGYSTSFSNLKILSSTEEETRVRVDLQQSEYVWKSATGSMKVRPGRPESVEIVLKPKPWRGYSVTAIAPPEGE